MKTYLEKRFANQSLTQAEAFQALSIIASGNASAGALAAFVTTYNMLPITVEELAGFRQAMYSFANLIDLSSFNPMDVCGTGGDGKDTFNISTTAAFVIAGAGQNIAKHGNHGVSSSVGSSTVLEHLGAKFTNKASILKTQIEKSGITFMHAPLFHPAMRHVGPFRKELSIKTFFNMLGPLLNPAQVTIQLTGVYSPFVQNLYQNILSANNTQFSIIHGLSGFDEISLTDNFILVNNKETKTMSHQDFSFNNYQLIDLQAGKNLEQSAKVMVNILQNKGTKAQTEVVLANVAIALQTANNSLNLNSAIALGKQSIESGKAYQSLKKYLETAN